MPSSNGLLPLAMELLQEAGAAFSDLDAIAFGAGPGAFTGLRVSCALAQGLACAHGQPLLPVGTLEAMAYLAEHETGVKRVLACLDARMGEVYSAVFVDGAMQGEPGVYAPGAVPLPRRVGNMGNMGTDAENGTENRTECGGTEWIAAGNALSAYPELAARLAAADFVLLPGILPGAAAVAALAAPRLARGEGIDAALAVPLYVRDKVARTEAERRAERQVESPTAFRAGGDRE